MAPGVGFNLGVGRGGKGAYFWKKSPYWAELARGVVSDCLKDGVYRSCANKSCCVLFVKIEVNGFEFLNLERDDVREALSKSYLNQFKNKTGVSKGDISSFHDLFYSTLEKNMGTTFRVVQKNVAPPQASEYPKMALGQPACYIVRDKTCIQQIIKGT